MAKRTIPLSQLNPADRAGRIARLVANPATRASIPTRFLPAQYRKQRELNARLAAPIVPGSGISRRQLAQQRNAAATVRYGPSEAQLGRDLATEQQQARDTAAWYDQYQSSLRAHQANVAQINSQATDAVKALTGSIGSLGAADQGYVAQQQAAQQQVTGGVANPQLAQDAANASTLRQALLGSFGAQMALTGGANQTYAANLADVVAPGQKLQAQAQGAGRIAGVRQKQTDLAKERGAWGQTYEAQITADEAKNMLAAQAANLNVAKATATATDKATRAAETARHNQALESIKLGIDPRTGKRLPKKPTTAAERKAALEVAYFKQHGFWPSTGAPSDTGPGGTPLLAPAAQQKMASDIRRVVEMLGRPPVWPGGPNKGRRMTEGEVARSLKGGGVLAPKGSVDPALIDVAVSLHRNKGKLGPDGVRKAHALGLKVSGRWQTVR